METPMPSRGEIWLKTDGDARYIIHSIIEAEDNQAETFGNELPQIIIYQRIDTDGHPIGSLKGITVRAWVGEDDETPATWKKYVDESWWSMESD